MGRACSVAGCRTGYKGKQDKGRPKLSRFSFPMDLDECKLWLAALPNKIRLEDVTKNMSVCERHWSGWLDGSTPRRRNGLIYYPTVPPDLFDFTPYPADYGRYVNNKVKSKTRVKLNNTNVKEKLKPHEKNKSKSKAIRKINESNALCSKPICSEAKTSDKDTYSECIIDDMSEDLTDTNEPCHSSPSTAVYPKDNDGKPPHQYTVLKDEVLEKNNAFDSGAFHEPFIDKLSQAGFVSYHAAMKSYILLSHNKIGPFHDHSLYFHIMDDQKFVLQCEIHIKYSIMNTEQSTFVIKMYECMIDSWTSLDKLLNFTSSCNEFYENSQPPLSHFTHMQDFTISIKPGQYMIIYKLLGNTCSRLNCKKIISSGLCLNGFHLVNK